MSDNWDDYYLVGKGGGFKPCFTTTTLSKENQIEYHQMLLEGINEDINSQAAYGFIGSHLERELSKLGHSVHIIDRLRVSRSNYHRGEICDPYPHAGDI